MSGSQNDVMFNIFESSKTVFSIGSAEILMSGVGELTDNKMKTFVRNKLRKETMQLLQFFRAFL